MKKILTIATLTLGLSAVAGSALAASNNDMWGAQSSEAVNVEKMAKEKGMTAAELTAKFEKENKKVADLTEATEAKPGNTDTWGAKSSEAVNVEKMAKEKGMTVAELIAQFKKENKKVADLTEATEAKQGNNDTWGAKSSEPVNLEKMAKEKGITVDQLIAQLEKEGTLTKAAEVTEAKQVETNNK